MLCEEVMKKDLHCSNPEDTVEDAAKRMRDRGIGFLPICDSRGVIVGTLTDRDIAVRVVAEGRSGKTRCSDVMTREVVSCKARDNLLKAEALMSERQKSRIMVLDDDGALIGVISLSDIAQRDSDRHAARVLREVSERESFTVH
jgi:CBS domain-containing protein